MSELNFLHSNGNKVKLTTPDTLAANTTFKLPGADGSAGQFLKTDGSGALSFGTPAAAPGTILQTVYNSTTTEGGTTSSSFQNWSGLATNITPLSSTSHLWIWINAIRLNVQQDSNEGRLRVTDGTNNTEQYRCFNYDSDNNYPVSYTHLTLPTMIRV